MSRTGFGAITNADESSTGEFTNVNMFKETVDILFEFIGRSYVKTLSAIRLRRRRIWLWRVERLKNLNKRTRVFLVFVIVLSIFFYIEALAPPAQFPTETLVSIERGTTLSAIAQHLQGEQVIKSAFWFEFLVRAKGNEHEIRAGDYLFKHPSNIFSVAQILRLGAFGLEPVPITVPEGATVADMAVVYDEHLLRFDPETFFLLALDLEGYLFPDTYYFLPNVSEAEVIRVMQDNFTQKTKSLSAQLVNSKRSLSEIVTMASIVEKEARNEQDRRFISGVLWNRIDQGMLLQVDATFVYTHDKGTYGITIEELRDQSNPCTAYVHRGLPPSPIAAPGLSSLNAAINPIESDYLFYLADRKGTTYYSETYEEHLVKKRKYVD